MILYARFIGRLITMFHDINHQPLFRNRKLNVVFREVLGLLYGFTPFTYFSHHIMIHHPESNAYNDISSTLAFNRDSVKDFLRYYFRFFLSLFALRNYLLKSPNIKKRNAGNNAFTGEVIYILLMFGFFYLNPLESMVLVIIPFFVTRSLLIIGNWGEHAFIDPDDENNLYRNSTNILGRYNKSTFNVGYHIGHHLHPHLHYSELPIEFNHHIEKYGKEDIMIFNDLHYPHIWYYLMKKNYRKLASCYVKLPHAPVRTETELINTMKRRTRAIELDKSHTDFNKSYQQKRKSSIPVTTIHHN